MTDRIVAAYSGAPRAASSLRAMVQAQSGDVVALILDLGQGIDLEEAHDRARAAGVVRAHVLDVREIFAREFVLPALHAGLRAETGDAVPIALARPLIGRMLVEVARMEQATAVAHGGTGAARADIEAAIRRLDPGLSILALPPAPAAGRLPAVRATLWGRLVEYADEADGLPESVFTWTKPASAASAPAAHVEIGFTRGVPATLNAVSLPLTELVECLSIIAGQHGIGRVPIVPSDAAPGRRHVLEIPAALVLQSAYGALEAASPTQATGVVRIEFHQGGHTVLGCRPASTAAAATTAAPTPS